MGKELMKGGIKVDLQNHIELVLAVSPDAQGKFARFEDGKFTKVIDGRVNVQYVYRYGREARVYRIATLLPEAEVDMYDGIVTRFTYSGTPFQLEMRLVEAEFKHKETGEKVIDYVIDDPITLIKDWAAEANTEGWIKLKSKTFILKGLEELMMNLEEAMGIRLAAMKEKDSVLAEYGDRVDRAFFAKIRTVHQSEHNTLKGSWNARIPVLRNEKIPEIGEDGNPVIGGFDEVRYHVNRTSLLFKQDGFCPDANTASRLPFAVNKGVRQDPETGEWVGYNMSSTPYVTRRPVGRNESPDITGLPVIRNGKPYEEMSIVGADPEYPILGSVNALVVCPSSDGNCLHADLHQICNDEFADLVKEIGNERTLRFTSEVKGEEPWFVVKKRSGTITQDLTDLKLGTMLRSRGNKKFRVRVPIAEPDELGRNFRRESLDIDGKHCFVNKIERIPNNNGTVTIVLTVWELLEPSKLSWVCSLYKGEIERLRRHKGFRIQIAPGVFRKADLATQINIGRGENAALDMMKRGLYQWSKLGFKSLRDIKPEDVYYTGLDIKGQLADAEKIDADLQASGLDVNEHGKVMVYNEDLTPYGYCYVGVIGVRFLHDVKHVRNEHPRFSNQAMCKLLEFDDPDLVAKFEGKDDVNSTMRDICKTANWDGSIDQLRRDTHEMNIAIWAPGTEEEYNLSNATYGPIQTFDEFETNVVTLDRLRELESSHPIWAPDQYDENGKLIRKVICILDAKYTMIREGNELDEEGNLKKQTISFDRRYQILPPTSVLTAMSKQEDGTYRCNEVLSATNRLLVPMKALMKKQQDIAEGKTNNFDYYARLNVIFPFFIRTLIAAQVGGNGNYAKSVSLKPKRRPKGAFGLMHGFPEWAIKAALRYNGLPEDGTDDYLNIVGLIESEEGSKERYGFKAPTHPDRLVEKDPNISKPGPFDVEIDGKIYAPGDSDYAINIRYPEDKFLTCMVLILPYWIKSLTGDVIFNRAGVMTTKGGDTDGDQHGLWGFIDKELGRRMYLKSKVVCKDFLLAGERDNYEVTHTKIAAAVSTALDNYTDYYAAKEKAYISMANSLLIGLIKSLQGFMELAAYNIGLYALKLVLEVFIPYGQSLIDLKKDKAHKHIQVESDCFEIIIGNPMDPALKDPIPEDKLRAYLNAAARVINEDKVRFHPEKIITMMKLVCGVNRDGDIYRMWTVRKRSPILQVCKARINVNIQDPKDKSVFTAAKRLETYVFEHAKDRKCPLNRYHLGEF